MSSQNSKNNQNIKSSKLKLKIMRNKGTGRTLRRIYIEPAIHPTLLEVDESIVAHNKKVGGQYNEYYYLKPVKDRVQNYYFKLETEDALLEFEDRVNFHAINFEFLGVNDEQGISGPKVHPQVQRKDPEDV